METWVDHRQGIEPGTPNWDKAIREAIAGCNFGLLVMSPRSLASDICAAECLLLRDLGKPLYVLLLDTCPPATIWLYIRLIQYVDGRADLAAAVSRLLGAIERWVAGSERHRDDPRPLIVRPYSPPPVRIPRDEWIDDRLRRVLDDPYVTPRLRVIVGEPNVGKTERLHQVQERAEAEGRYRVLLLSALGPNEVYREKTEAYLWLIESLWEQICHLPEARSYWECYQADLQADPDSCTCLSRLSGALRALGQQQPILLLVDDLHVVEEDFRRFFLSRSFQLGTLQVLATWRQDGLRAAPKAQDAKILSLPSPVAASKRYSCCAWKPSADRSLLLGSLAGSSFTWGTPWITQRRVCWPGCAAGSHAPTVRPASAS
ncbi:MAG: TIR domain-containing protein [Aggregatilineales bacterium]